MKRLFLLLALAAAPAFGVIRFNDGAAMTTAASFAGSKRAPGGGIILHLTGTFDGASVALEVNGGNAWVAADTCATMTVAQVCRAAVGPVALRLTITSAGAGTSLQAVGFEAQAIVASVSGGGTSSWTTITGGTSTEAFLVGAGGSFGATSTGTVHATGLTQSAAVGDAIVTLRPTGVNVGFGAKPGSTNPHVFWDAVVTQDAYMWFEDSAGTWSGINFAVGSNRWLVARAGNALRSESNVGMVSDRDIDTASFRPHTSFDIGLGGDSSGTMGSLVYDSAVATWTSSTFAILGCTNFGPLTSAPTANGACDTYFDTDVARLCFWSGAAWLQVDDSTTGCS